MTALVRNELLRLRTTRSTWGLAVIGLVMLYAAIKKFETIKALPETRQALKETVTWQTNPK